MGPTYTPLTPAVTQGTTSKAKEPQESKLIHDTCASPLPSDPTATTCVCLDPPAVFWLSLLYTIIHSTFLYLTLADSLSPVLHMKIPALLWVGTIQLSNPWVWVFNMYSKPSLKYFLSYWLCHGAIYYLPS